MKTECRVIRGGCWRSPAQDCRSACHDGGHPGSRGNNIGFRPVLKKKQTKKMKNEIMTEMMAQIDSSMRDRVIGDYRGQGYSVFGGLPMIWCPAGEFVMGSPEIEEGRWQDEEQHIVQLSQGFFLARTPVTQAQWKSVMGNNPSRFIGELNPVERVSWDDAHEYLSKMNELFPVDGWEWGLPTEAEWEYACRAGTDAPYFFGDRDLLGDYAWYYQNSSDTTHPVGEKLPNPWGFYDIVGNVWEWCQDVYGPYYGDEKVMRGGSWLRTAQRCRSAGRSRNNPGSRYSNVGFRPVLRENPIKNHE